MTPRQLSVLNRAAAGDDILPGTALMFEHQRGCTRQVKWLLARKLVRQRHGRIIATKYGRKILDYQLSPTR